jgi:hypothetical protein
MFLKFGVVCYFMKFGFFLLVLFVLSIFIFLSGCTGQTPVCGDGVCGFVEQDPRSPFYCPEDCGEIVCPDVWDPVCGVDGVTYSNECYAGLAGIKVDYVGECVEEELDLSVQIETTKTEYVVGEEVQLR